MANTMNQTSIDNIYKHSGKLDVILTLMSDAKTALNAGDENKLCEIAERLAMIHSQQMNNDLGCFKHFFNRSQHKS